MMKDKNERRKKGEILKKVETLEKAFLKKWKSLLKEKRKLLKKQEAFLKNGRIC